MISDGFARSLQHPDSNHDTLDRYGFSIVKLKIPIAKERCPGRAPLGNVLRFPVILQRRLILPSLRDVYETGFEDVLRVCIRKAAILSPTRGDHALNCLARRLQVFGWHTEGTNDY
jgi:hypothetical protein